MVLLSDVMLWLEFSLCGSKRFSFNRDRSACVCVTGQNTQDSEIKSDVCVCNRSGSASGVTVKAANSKLKPKTVSEKCKSQAVFLLQGQFE